MQMFINNNDYLVIKANKKYYPRTLLEECKYIQEKTKIENYINEDLENSESVILIVRRNLILIMKNNLSKVFQ